MIIEETPIALFDVIPHNECDDGEHIFELGQELIQENAWIGSPLVGYKNEEDEIQLVLENIKVFVVFALKCLLGNVYYIGSGYDIMVPILIIEEDEMDEILSLNAGELPDTADEWYEAFSELGLKQAATAALHVEDN